MVLCSAVKIQKKTKIDDPARFKIVGDIRAGDLKRRKLKRGETYRIMTGAVIPKRSDTILVKEQARIEKKKLAVYAPVRKGLHIRYRGEEMNEGELLIPKHAQVHPATVGILAMQGIAEVWIYKKPRVSVLATGTELVEPGKKLKFGQIYDSNSHMMPPIKV